LSPIRLVFLFFFFKLDLCSRALFPFHRRRYVTAHIVWEPLLSYFVLVFYYPERRLYFCRRQFRVKRSGWFKNNTQSKKNKTSTDGERGWHKKERRSLTVSRNSCDEWRRDDVSGFKSGRCTKFRRWPRWTFSQNV